MGPPRATARGGPAGRSPPAENDVKTHDVELWIDRLIARHTASLTRPELLKAIRALSVKYVERRESLADRSAIDSAGKRAAFAAFYAPLHFLTVRAIVRERAAVTPHTIIDAGCGTGVSGAAWAVECASRPGLQGVDVSGWALDEARWNWRELGLGGRTTRGDLLRALGDLARKGARSADGPVAVVLGWSLNELETTKRARALDALLVLAGHGYPILMVEPIATRIVPWWAGWTARAHAAGGHAAEWRFPAQLPPALAALDEAAGFRRQELTARTVDFNLGVSR
jgi:hypothetical protein